MKTSLGLRFRSCVEKAALERTEHCYEHASRNVIEQEESKGLRIVNIEVVIEARRPDIVVVGKREKS